MQKHPTHKNAKGFTLIELVIAVAIIGILTSVAVLGYNQYKVRAYDAHSKQALRDVLLQCNAFWLDHDASKVCNHATVAEVYVASDEIVIKFPSKDLPDLLAGSHGNFCASAQHVSSPNPYSIDSASLIREGSGCNGAGGASTTGQTFETYNNKSAEDACKETVKKHPQGETHIFGMVGADGKLVSGRGLYKSKPWQVFSDCEQPLHPARGGMVATYNTPWKMARYQLEEARLVYIGSHPKPTPEERIEDLKKMGYKTQGGYGLEDGANYRTPDGVDRGRAARWVEEGKDWSTWGEEDRQRIATCGLCAEIEQTDGITQEGIMRKGSDGLWRWTREPRGKRTLTYNFETGVWSGEDGKRFQNGERVE